MTYLKPILLFAVILLIGCKENKPKQNNVAKPNEENVAMSVKKETSEREEKRVNTPLKKRAVILEEQIYFAGTWSGKEDKPLVNLEIEEGGKFTVKECSSPAASRCATYKAAYKDGKVIALVYASDFKGGVVPFFEFSDENADTLVFTSGLGTQLLTKTDREMPRVRYVVVREKE